jgi:hypothetical protein
MWKVITATSDANLEDELNALERDGYTIREYNAVSHQRFQIVAHRPGEATGKAKTATVSPVTVVEPDAAQQYRELEAGLPTLPDAPDGTIEGFEAGPIPGLDWGSTDARERDAEMIQRSADLADIAGDPQQPPSPRDRLDIDAVLRQRPDLNVEITPHTPPPRPPG